MSYYGRIEQPLREALKALCGEEPPDIVTDQTRLSEFGDDVIVIQDWCASHARPEWSTGLAIMEAAEAIVLEAIGNDNIDDIRKKNPRIEQVERILLDLTEDISMSPHPIRDVLWVQCHRAMLLFDDDGPQTIEAQVVAQAWSNALSSCLGVLKGHRDDWEDYVRTTLKLALSLVPEKWRWMTNRS